MLPTTGSKITPAIFAPCVEESGFQPSDVVVCQNERVGTSACGDAGRVGYGERGRGTAGCDEQAVDVPW